MIDCGDKVVSGVDIFLHGRLGVDEAELESGSSSEEEEEEEEGEGGGNNGKPPLVLGSAGSSDESSSSPKSTETLDKPGPSGLQVTPPVLKQPPRTLENSSEQSSVSEVGTDTKPTESKDSETATDREDVVCGVTKAERQQEAQSERDMEREQDHGDQKSDTSDQADKEETADQVSLVPRFIAVFIPIQCC